MIDIKTLEEKLKELTYNPDTEEKILQTFIKQRVDELQKHRRELKIEDKWKEADKEYVPREMEFSSQGKRFENFWLWLKS